jgi:GxxExxY protein
MIENEIGTIVVESAIAVHRELGPGLLETVYEVILAHELCKRGLPGTARTGADSYKCERLLS